MKKYINLNKTKINKLVFNKPGDYLVFFRNLSGKFHFELKQKDINVEIYGIFVGKNTDSFDIETIQHHSAPSSTSKLFIKGVFYDDAKFKYQGLIRIEAAAQKSHAYQKNQNLLLSDKTFIDSKPYLEILADDVFCTHGSTSGGLNEDQIYYLKTRGLSQSQAEKILIDGFINEISEKIKYLC